MNISQSAAFFGKTYLPKVEACGVKGMKSTSWRKVFRNQGAFEKWMEKNEGGISVHGVRDVEESR